MNQLERLHQLNQILLEELPQYLPQSQKFANTQTEQHRLFRSLMNLRPPRPVREDYAKIEAAYLTEERQVKGIVTLDELTECQPNLYLWRGDITRLQVDAIVNAANDALLGCFAPCHNCIDNAIHSGAGVQLRVACHQLMEQQGYREPTGKAKITEAYHLPSSYVLHTVGPIIYGDLTQADCDLLADCYRACLQLAIDKGLGSVAFCCISTGEFRFPNQRASEIAVQTVQSVLSETKAKIKVIFNVFKEEDQQYYRALLG